MKTHIAIDVGGTQIRAAYFPEDSLTPLRVNKIPTQAEGDTPLDRITSAISSIWPQGEEVAAIGIVAPGPINPYKGIIYTAPNIPGFENLPLAPLLHERFNVPVFLGNDANLAAVGEWQYGAGQGHHHLLYITVSTGIGTGVIHDDRLILGAKGLATELGHTIVAPDGPLCGCGKRGHVEAFSSGTAIARWVEEELAKGTSSILPTDRSVSAREIAAAARAGDDLSKRAFDRAGKYLGFGLANFLHIFNPSIVVIGGGVSFSGDLLFTPMRAALNEQIISERYFDELQIIPAKLGDDAGLMGALALARGLA